MREKGKSTAEVSCLGITTLGRSHAAVPREKGLANILTALLTREALGHTLQTRPGELLQAIATNLLGSTSSQLLSLINVNSFALRKTLLFCKTPKFLLLSKSALNHSNNYHIFRHFTVRYANMVTFLQVNCGTRWNEHLLNC